MAIPKRTVEVNVFGRLTRVEIEDDGEPPSGVREPRRPEPTGGDGATEAEEPAS